ncbi:MAG: hypothetical protein V5B30_15635 [Candidatus Accumulibacter delftensis]
MCWPPDDPCAAPVIRIFLLLPLLAAAVLFLAGLETAPLVSRSASISPASVAEARGLLLSNDPRRLRRGEQRTAQIPVALIDEAFNHLATRSLHGRGAFALVDETGEFRFCVPVQLPGLSGARYLNLRAVFHAGGGRGQAQLASASLGSLSIPPRLFEWLSVSVIEIAGLGEQWQLLRKAFRRLDFVPARSAVAFTYVWEPGLLDRARALAFTPADNQRVEAAQRALASLLMNYPVNARVPLSEVLPPLLAGPEGEETLQKRRAALLVLAAYESGKSLDALFPQASDWPRPRRLKLELLGRYDSAQHFAISAALAVWAGEPAANAIGVYKEIDDSRRGSGFSFADLAADRAGTRFGELLLDDPARVNAALRGSLRDSDLAPPLGGLPEYLSAAQFERRYGGQDNPAYRQVSADIEARVAALPLYR